MKKVSIISGRGVPLKRSDVDTDQIIPAEWLKRVERTGFEKGLFSTWRDDRNFVLNDERYVGASVLVAGPSFGVGSSREHAVWALQQGGFDAVIAPSFSDIFRNNCTKNGLLPIVLSEPTVNRIWAVIENDATAEITIDLHRFTVEIPVLGSPRSSTWTPKLSSVSSTVLTTSASRWLMPMQFLSSRLLARLGLLPANYKLLVVEKTEQVAQAHIV